MARVPSLLLAQMMARALPDEADRCVAKVAHFPTMVHVAAMESLGVRSMPVLLTVQDRFTGRSWKKTVELNQ